MRCVYVVFLLLCYLDVYEFLVKGYFWVYIHVQCVAVYLHC